MMPLPLLVSLVICGGRAVLGATQLPSPPNITGDTDINNTDINYCATRNPQFNISLTCKSQEGSVIWLLGDYTMVDRDQFLMGYDVLITGNEAIEAELNLLLPRAINFLFDRFDSGVVDITCQVVTDEINTVRSEQIITIYRDFTAVDQPSVAVTRCNDDGTLTVSITYTEVDICSMNTSLNYTLTLSNGPTPDATDEMGLVYEVKVDPGNVDGLTAIMTVCNRVLCRVTETDLSNLTCNSATVKWCMCNDDDCLHDIYSIVECNIPGDPDSKWDCQFTSDGRVEDVYNETVVANGWKRIPSLSYQGLCNIATPTATPSATPSVETSSSSTSCTEELLGVGLGAGLGPLGAGIIIAVIFGLLIIIFCCKPPMIKKDLPLEARNPQELEKLKP